MMELFEFVELFCSLPPEKKEALEQFLEASEAGCTTSEAIERVQDKDIREEMLSVMMKNATA